MQSADSSESCCACSAEKPPYASAPTQHKLIAASCCMLSHLQMFSQRTRTIRDEAAADCQQRLVQLFRGHSINDALEDLIELLHKQRRDVERIIEISPGSLFKGFEIYDRMLRSMDRLSFNHKRTLPEHYGKVEKEVGSVEMCALVQT